MTRCIKYQVQIESKYGRISGLRLYRKVKNNGKDIISLEASYFRLIL